MNKISIHETFTAGDVINDPKRFAGRKEDIKRALLALRRPGCSLMIYGERGVGKSSFANMIKQIAAGNKYLIEKHNLQGHYDENKCLYKIVSVTCDDGTKSVEDVLQRLITSPQGLRKEFKYKVESIESSDNDQIGFDLKLFKASNDKNTTFKISAYKEQSIFEIFSNIILFIKDKILKNGEGLLIHIDEFDIVNDKAPLASLIKSLSTDMVKFMISGIAHDYTELISGHKSIIRQLQQGRIKIDPMNDAEFNMVFDLASKLNKDKLIFNSKFRKLAFEMSDGFPYFIQLFGQIAVDNFTTNNIGYGTVNSIHLKDGLKYFVKYEPRLEELYYSIVGDKKEREVGLKYIANQAKKMIRRSDILEYINKNSMVEDSKKVVTYLLAFRDKQLASDNEKIITAVGEDYIMFTSTLFKIYVRTRENIFD